MDVSTLPNSHRGPTPFPFTVLVLVEVLMPAPSPGGTGSTGPQWLTQDEACDPNLDLFPKLLPELSKKKHLF